MHWYAIFFLLFSITQLFSGIDSLRYVISNTTGADRIKARLEYSEESAGSDYKSAVSQAEDALAEARAIHDQSFTVRALTQLSILERQKSDLDNAEKHLLLALPLAEEMKDFELSSKIRMELGRVYISRGDNYMAMEYVKNARDDAEKINNHRILGSCYAMISNIYRVLGVFDKSLESIIQAKSEYELAGFEEGAAWVAYSLGRLYRDLGMYDEAMNSVNEALATYSIMAEANGDSIGVALCLDQIGLLHLEQNNAELAQSYLLRSLKIYTEGNSNYGVSNARKNLGKVAYVNGHYTIAKEYLQQSLEEKLRIHDALGIPGVYEYLGLVLVGEGHWQAGVDTLIVGLEKANSNNQRQAQFNLNGHLAHAFEDVNMPLEAIKYYKLQHSLQDSILPNPVRFKLPELRSIYESEQNRQEIKELNQKNEIIKLELARQRAIQWGLYIGSLFLLIFTAVVIRQYLNVRSLNSVNEELIKNLQLEIKQRKKAEAERLIVENKLRQSQKLEAVGTMVNGIAHELNNVLQRIFLYAGILENQLQDVNSKHSLKAIMDSGEYAKKIVTQVMIFSRRSIAAMEAQDLQPILKDALDLVKAELPTQIELIENIPEDLGPVLCDATQMKEVISNLLKNALEAMVDGGKLSIDLHKVMSSELNGNINESKNQVSLELSISDTGHGIDPETLEKIFDPFFTTKEVGKGTGLGLSVAHGLITQMGGSISVASQIGVGSTFRILLPLFES